MNRDLLMEMLEGIRFLHDDSREHLEQIADIAVVRDFAEHEIIFRTGAVADHVYLVVSGNVSLEICAPGIGCRRILTVGPGELLGWSALLEQSRMTATARAIETTRLVELDARQLLAICEQNLQFGYEFLCRTLLALAKRLSATRMQLIDVYGSQLPATSHVAEAQDGS